MTIRYDIMIEMGISLFCSDHCFKRNDVCIPLNYKENYLTESTMKECTTCILTLQSFNRWKSVKDIHWTLVILKLIVILWWTVLIFNNQVKEL